MLGGHGRKSRQRGAPAACPILGVPRKRGGSGRGRSSPPVRPSHRPPPPQGARALPTFPRVEGRPRAGRRAGPGRSRPGRARSGRSSRSRSSRSSSRLPRSPASPSRSCWCRTRARPSRRWRHARPLADPRPQGASEERTGVQESVVHAQPRTQRFARGAPEPTLERGIPINFPRRVATVRYAPAAALGVPPVAALPMKSRCPARRSRARKARRRRA